MSNPTQSDDAGLPPITDKIARYGDGTIVYFNREAVVPISMVLKYVEHYRAELAKSNQQLREAHKVGYTTGRIRETA